MKSWNLVVETQIFCKIPYLHDVLSLSRPFFQLKVVKTIYIENLCLCPPNVNLSWKCVINIFLRLQNSRLGLENSFMVNWKYWIVVFLIVFLKFWQKKAKIKKCLKITSCMNFFLNIWIWHPIFTLSRILIYKLRFKNIWVKYSSKKCCFVWHYILPTWKTEAIHL